MLSQEEQQRLQILNGILEGTYSMGQAAKLMGVSERHGWRLLAAYRKEGAAALAHGNRGRSPAHRIANDLRERVASLARSPAYACCNHQHFTELLVEREGIELSRPTVRRILGEIGLRSPRRRRPPKHRSRRERMEQEGMLLQLDGSPHDWLEGRGPRLTLVGAIDDATGTVPAATFRDQEDAQGYFLVLKQVLVTKGIPLAVYRDRSGIFERRPNRRWSLEEELTGAAFPTQVGRCLAELGVRSIAARSPQAKGRIERLWGTLQDRLVIELRLAGAATLDQANEVLKAYLPRFNAQFGVPALDSGTSYRPLPTGLDLDAVCCFKYERTVANDNTVTLGEHRLQIRPDRRRQSYTRARVEVQERLDGSLVVHYQGRTLLTTRAPATAPILRARSGRRSPATAAAGVGKSTIAALSGKTRVADFPTPRRPAPDHPWRRTYRIKERLTKSLTT